MGLGIIRYCNFQRGIRALEDLTKKKKHNATKRNKRTKSRRKCYITPAFSGIFDAKRAEQNQKWSPTQGTKIRNGCLTPTFSGTQKRAEMLCLPCILGDPQCQVRGAMLCYGETVAILI